ncbi:HET-domain-containing protein [Xylariaceae sp. FL1019]|nr:HET-domain-containing protein [Xylariaceae sp. FL1019]
MSPTFNVPVMTPDSSTSDNSTPSSGDCGRSKCKCCYDDWSISFSKRPQEFESAARAGCKWCEIRHNAVSWFSSNPEDIVEFSALHTFEINGRPHQIFQTLDTPDDKFPHIAEGNFASDQTSSQQTFDFIRHWLSECTSSHNVCIESRSCSKYTPKRLVEVSNNNIVLREGLTEVRYACLSHCWGQSQKILKTSTNTLEDLKLTIPWGELRKTFQDAVDICRRLQIDYIWIDSLCIIQDNDKDWKEQSVQIVDIYENAFLTIAATGSYDGDGGCYAVPDPEFRGRPVMEGSIYVRQKMPKLETMYWFNDSLRQWPSDWPLLRRAWVYQEMQLSSRVLHFGSHEVIWQCRTLRRSETGSNDSHIGSTFSRPFNLKDDWNEKIAHYSGLSLTFEKDRFAALAAISQREAQKRGPGDEFLLGLWKKTLRENLLWYATSVGERMNYLKAPTWSWASIKSAVEWQWLHRWEDAFDLNCTEIQAINIRYVGSPFLGDYDKAEIVICGPLIASTLIALNYGVAEDADRCTLGLGQQKCIPSLVADYDYATSSTCQVSTAATIFILPFQYRQRLQFRFYVLGLALVSANANSAKTYRRIGMVRLQSISRSGELGAFCHEPVEKELLTSYLSSLPIHNITLI